MPTPHEHLVLETDDGWRLGFVDPRRFGSVDLVPTPQEDAHRLLADLGPEPLDAAFTPPACRPRWPASARRSRRRCWTRRSLPGWATSMSARRCSAPASARSVGPHDPGRPRRPAGAGDQGDAARGDRRRRFVAARLRAAGRRTGLFPARLEGVWPRGRAVRALPGPPACPGIRRIMQSGAQHVLLPAHPAIATSRATSTGESERWPTSRTSWSKRMAGSA